ncbi:hypothetical protein KEM60_01376 [Austwickia sp. TVS 96-490-7B]|uniref:ABC transporter permease n=1 Tax=Austwickia sp. TVS 96-490-7B TaxID=2830843 RepID=UPI001C584324|nr:ABC transporter permease [Austwickia sp. TVS 96-490-7B]MBW3085179.1 hypothetical protein [Austwickia sp. TVS 96-490-7B]
MIAWRLVERHARVYRRDWLVLMSGFVEPVLYLFTIGIGVGAMVPGVQVGGRTVGYPEFVASAMVATSAMNGAVMDSTYNLFFRMKYAKLYDMVLATPMTTGDVAVGETLWSTMRSGCYSAVFLVVMAVAGVSRSWWLVAVWLAALLIGLAFAGVGMWAATHLRSWQDFEFINVVIVPMTLFSGTFFPVEALSWPLRWLMEVTPLYRGVVLCRDLSLGEPGWSAWCSVVYLVALGAVGMWFAHRRLAMMLLR